LRSKADNCMLALGIETITEILDDELKQVAKLKKIRDILLYIVIGSVILIGCVIIGTRSPHVFSTKPATHEQNAAIPEKWQFTATGVIIGALALGEDGTLYAASEDGFVYALDAYGNLQWKFDAGPMAAGPTIGADGTIYVTNKEQRIFAINSTGTQQWANGGGLYADKQMGRIVAAIDQTYLYTPWRGQLRAIRLSTGAFEWPAGMGFERGGSVGILSSGLIVYPGVGRVDAVDSRGITVWQYPVMDPPLSTDTLLANDGHPPSGNFWLGSGIAVAADGTFYAGVNDSGLVAFTPAGTYLWQFKTKPRAINWANPVIAADGTIYFGSGDGSLYALNSDGTQKWAVDTGAGIAASTPMLAEDGTIYFANSTALIAVSPEGKVLAGVPIIG
jgi:outer membrane protein assembly factor BamB